MIKKITDVGKMITWVIAAIISVFSLKFYWDFYKSQKEDEKENDDYVED